jgi:uncharacterized protein
VKTLSLLVPVADLEREDEVSREWELDPGWLGWALGDSEAHSTGKPGRARATLSRSGREVLVRGRVEAQVELPCARTLDPSVYDLAVDLVLILHKKEEPASGGSHASRRGSRREVREAREAEALAADDVASDSYSGETIALDDFVREQLLLELPMFPLRSDLRSNDSPAIPPPPQGPASGSGIDPRLLPLQALADRLKAGK